MMDTEVEVMDTDITKNGSVSVAMTVTMVAITVRIAGPEG